MSTSHPAGPQKPERPPAPARHILRRDQWQPLAQAHERAVDEYIQPFLARRATRTPHPVHDFLFTYYSLTPAQLRRWHPGAAAAVQDPDPARLGWKFYREVSGADVGGTATGRTAVVSVPEFLNQRESTVRFTQELLQRTAARPAGFGCFGLHEWAMAYHSDSSPVRHSYLPLRLGASGTDRVVEQSRIRCTHFDAFRFYHPEAARLNEFTPTRQTQQGLEQPGCLHANMDLYKWAYKLLPLISSATLLACFELAWRIREVDMRAAPYDLRDFGYPPIRVETAAGKAEYVRLQRSFAHDASRLRKRLLAELDLALTFS